MKDIDEIMKASSEDFSYIGERLRMIRDELIEKDSGNKRTSEFSRKKVADVISKETIPSKSARF